MGWFPSFRDIFGVGDAGEAARDGAREMADAGRHVADQGKEAVGGAMETGAKSLEHVADKAKEGAESLGNKVKPGAEGIKQVGDFLERITGPTQTILKVAPVVAFALTAAAIANSTMTAEAERDLIRANTESIQIKTQGERVQQSEPARQMHTDDVTQEVAVVTLRVSSILREAIKDAKGFAECRAQGGSMCLLPVAIVHNTESASQLDGYADALDEPADVNVRPLTLFTSSGGQGSMDEIEALITREWQGGQFREDRDIFVVYIILAPLVSHGHQSPSYIPFTHFGPLASKFARVYGHCHKGMPIHCLPAALSLHSNLGPDHVLRNDKPILAMLASDEGRAFLRARFHDILFVASRGDIQHARSWKAAAKRHTWIATKAVILPTVLVLVSPAVVPAAAISAIGLTASYAVKEVRSFALGNTYLYSTSGAVEMGSEAKALWKRTFGWRVSYWKV